MMGRDQEGCYNSSLFQSTKEYENYEKVKRNSEFPTILWWILKFERRLCQKKHISVNFTFTFKHFIMQKRSQYYRCWLAVRFKRNSKVQTFKVKLIIDNQTHIKYILFVLVFSSPVYSDYHFGRSWAGWQHIQHCRALKVETLWSLKCLSGNWQAWGQNPIQIPNPRTWAVTKILWATHPTVNPTLLANP